MKELLVVVKVDSKEIEAVIDDLDKAKALLNKCYNRLDCLGSIEIKESDGVK